MLCYVFKFKFKCFIYPTEVHDIIYNLYVVRFWREGGQRSIAYRAVHLNTKTLIHGYCKLSIYHCRILIYFCSLYVNLTHTLPICFVYAGSVIRHYCPSVNETTLKNMGKYTTQNGGFHIHIEAKTQWPPAFRWHFLINLVKEKCCILSQFRWNMFPRVQFSIGQHWFRWGFGADQAAIH